MKLAVWAGLSLEGVDMVMLRKQGAIDCLEKLFPIEEAGRPSVESLGSNNNVPIGGKGKCWEAQEETPSNQILDVQGRLKSIVIFWKEFGGTSICPKLLSTNFPDITY